MPDPRPTLLDLPAVAERLGVNHRHIRRLVAERRIPFIKWGHLLRFDPAEIDRWIECHRVSPVGTRLNVSGGRYAHRGASQAGANGLTPSTTPV